jgi:hypothetical protein
MDARSRAVIEGIVAGARVPGCAIAVTDASTTLARLFVGDAVLEPRRPVTAATVFHLFSGTKLYTAAALMVLAQAGRLDADRRGDAPGSTNSGAAALRVGGPERLAEGRSAAAVRRQPTARGHAGAPATLSTSSRARRREAA